MMSLFLCVFLLSCLVWYLLFKFCSIRYKKHDKKLTVGFFHPYCNAAGGGERVLWAAIRAIQKEYKEAHCVVYSGDDIATEDVLKNVELRFNIKLSREIEIVHLKRRSFVEAKYYPYFTLLGQSIGSIVLAFEAIFKYVPHIYIDTMGYAFTLPVFKLLGGCRVGSYVHFPTISTDMLKVVQSRKIGINNRKFISNSPFFSHLKLIYYKCFALLYGYMGRYSEVILVNSSWTRNHILQLWDKRNETFTVFPPCDVSEFSNIPLDRHRNQRDLIIMSIAQFRPEKNHELQIRAMHELLSRIGDVPNPPHLVIIGSCRHEDDYERVRKLQDLCSALNLTKFVDLKVNLTFQEIIEQMKNSSVALHTMQNEHFGISVVELIAAGLVMVAHNSGGPKMDIIYDKDESRTGFLANDLDSFANALEKIFKMDFDHLYEVRKAARKSMLRFSDQKFEESFLTAIKLLFY